MKTITQILTATPTHPRACAQIDVTEFEDRFMAYDRDNDKVHVLNRSAVEVLELCNGDRSAPDIAEALQLSYGLDTPPRREVDEILSRMEQTGLIGFHGPAVEAI